MTRRILTWVAALAAVLAGTLSVVGATAPAASAYSQFGVQKLLVVLIEHPHLGCPTASNQPQCPRYTAAEWQTILQRDLNSWYQAETYGRTSFDVHVLADPNTADGWWPAVHDQSEYHGDNFAANPSIGRDAGEVIPTIAMAEGALSPQELVSTHRLLMIDNFHARGGQSNSQGVPITYHPKFQFSGFTFSLNFDTTVSVVPEDANDTDALSIYRHELGHQLGEPDLYSQHPCLLMPPGAPPETHDGDPADCVGPWDHMALDYASYPGFGAYMKEHLDFIDPDPLGASVRQVDNEFKGTVLLDPLERPAGGKLVLSIPQAPWLASLERIFGNLGPYRGLQVECRRQLGDDSGLPGSGALVTFVDPGRGGSQPEDVARGSSSQTASTAILSTPGASYQNSFLGVQITYAGATANGGCAIDVNKRRLIYPWYVPGAQALSAITQQTEAFGSTSSFSGFVGAGVVVNGGSARSSSRTLARGASLAAGSRGHKVRVHATRKGHRATVEFAYGNAGGRTARGGTAVVRVNDPYTVGVCGKQPRGRVVARVHLKTLKPGHHATQRVTFVPRSNGPLGVTVAIGRSGKKSYQAGASETGSLGFTTARSGHKKVVASRTKVRLSTKGCAGPTSVSLEPLVQPPGWTFTTKGLDAPLAPGRTVRATLVATPPAGARPAALDIPVALSAGAAHDPAPVGSTVSLYPSGVEPELVAGLDVLVALGKPGRPLPGFVLAGPPKLTPPPAQPATPPAPAASSLVLTCPPSSDTDVTVAGTLAPAEAGALVTLTYTHVGDGVTITHTASTGVNGGFSDAFSDPRPGWQVQASWLGDATAAASSSNTCDFGIIIGRSG